MSARQLVFMHYSNPSKDSKLTENRQKVAKYAMLNRPKQPVVNGHARTNPPPTTGRNTAWPTVPQYSPKERFESSPDAPSNASTRSTPPSISNTSLSAASLSPEIAAHSQDAYSQTGYFPLESSHVGPYLGQPARDRHGSSNSDNSEILNGVVFENGDMYPTQPVGVHSDFFQSPQVDFPTLPGLFGLNNLHNEQASRLAEKRRVQLVRRHESNRTPALRRNAGRNTKFEDMSFSQIPPFGDDLVSDENYGVRNNGPRSLLSATSSDPFNTLPIQANPHTHELLYQYMNARLISSVLLKGSPETFHRIKNIRQTVWWPLCFKSKASMNALVAYVESTPGLPIKSRTRDFLFQHVQAAIMAVGEALSKPNVATDDSICFAVVLLMLTAQREGSLETYATHAAGLDTLLKHRTDAIRRHGEQHSTVDQLQKFYDGEGSRDRCRYCESAYETGPASPTLSVSSEIRLATGVESFNAALQPRGEGFRDLVRDGLLSRSMAKFIEPAMIWSTLSERARRDKLSAAVGATHAWIDEGEFSLKGKWHSLDAACMTAVRICFYLSSWLDWQHSCPAVRRMSEAVYTVLEKADNIEHLLIACPKVLCWLALMVGPLCDGNARGWFAWLLIRARDALSLQIFDFESTVDVFSHSYVWSHTMTPGAEKFWNQVYFDDAQGSCAWGFSGVLDNGFDGGLDGGLDGSLDGGLEDSLWNT